ncbi:hypothetical protein PtA15_9A204 [Puccinia triticina]|uniref:Sec16 central conserved domain-containing protein n=1 Tax=Puccinia triticina TaxID=208348 RepID=A0ABY7CS43_9BASI|nr:uncharacterized protein PtA15_9A204 [Puccinia triticina]WAQ88079.1 hypothetical protein PtA15_9A204 [Puccinia triticina]
MDPWSSNEWVESTEPATSSTLPLELDLQPKSEHLPNQSTWPVPDLSLPNWDNPSPPKSSSPTPVSNDLPPADSSDSRSKLDPVALPIETLTINTQISSPASSNQSVFKTPDSAGSDKWAQSNQLPVNEPPNSSHESASSDAVQMTSPAIASASISADLSHSSRPGPGPDPDLDRWGTFTQTDLPPIASVIPFPNPEPPSFEPTSPIQSGWDGETHLGGWDDGLAIDRPLPSLGTSISIPRPEEDHDDDDQLDQGWSSPHLSDPDHSNRNDTSEDAWDPSGAHGTGAISSSVFDQGDLTPVQAGVSALSPGDQLTGNSGQLSKDHLPESSDRRTENSSQTAETIGAFQTAMSKTAQAATSMLKSANEPRNLFSKASTQSSITGSYAVDSTKPANSTISPDHLSWGDFSALGKPDSKSDALAMPDSQKTAQQQDQKKRASFFGFWSSKSQPAPTPASPPTQNTAIGPSPLAPIGIPDPLTSSLNHARGSVCSASTPSTPWPAPSPASPDAAQDPAPSAISRLFGRLGARSNHSSISTSTLDEQCEITAPSTELNANDIKFLDQVKTVPLEPKIVPYDDFPSRRNANQTEWTAKNTSSQSESGIFGFLSENSTSSKNLASQPSFPIGKDPFEFLDSLSGDSSRQKRNLGIQGSSSARSSSPKLTTMSSYPHVAPLSSHSNNSTIFAVSGPTDQKPVGDDLDDLFSHFQGAEISTQAKHSRPSPSGNNSAALRGFQKPLGTKSVPPLGSTQVRMASTVPKPILPRDSHSFPSSSCASTSKVPILAPPPSSSRPSTSGPIPLIPPPQNNMNKQVVVQNSNSQFGALNSLSPPGQNVNKDLPFRPPNSLSSYSQTPPLSSTTTKSASHKPNKANQPGGLSKEDLSFFDSLI